MGFRRIFYDRRLISDADVQAALPTPTPIAVATVAPIPAAAAAAAAAVPYATATPVPKAAVTPAAPARRARVRRTSTSAPAAVCGVFLTSPALISLEPTALWRCPAGGVLLPASFRWRPAGGSFVAPAVASVDIAVPAPPPAHFQLPPSSQEVQGKEASPALARTTQPAAPVFRSSKVALQHLQGPPAGRRAVPAERPQYHGAADPDRAAEAQQSVLPGQDSWVHVWLWLLRHEPQHHQDVCR